MAENTVFEVLDGFKTAEDFERFKFIYEHNFPEEERRPSEEIGGTAEEPRILIVGRDRESRQIIAIAVLATLPNTPALYLEYFAVDTTLHSRGLGSTFFNFMVSYFKENGDAQVFVWEVELDIPDEPEAQPNRRIRFYERLGAAIVPMDPSYKMPDLTGGEPLPMYLMQMPLKGQETAPTKQEIAAWVKGIYQIAYPDQLTLAEQIINDQH